MNTKEKFRLNTAVQNVILSQCENSIFPIFERNEEFSDKFFPDGFSYENLRKIIIWTFSKSKIDNLNITIQIEKGALDEFSTLKDEVNVEINRIDKDLHLLIRNEYQNLLNQ